MTDLERLITELCELPSLDLVGNEDTVTAQWASSSDGSTAFVKLGEWESIIYLDPTQALLLLAWLKPQEEKLVELRDALQAKKAEEEAAKAEREAERLTELKVKHSDTVVAWQQGGCEGPCPSFDEMVKACLVDPVLIANRYERQS